MCRKESRNGTFQRLQLKLKITNTSYTSFETIPRLEAPIRVFTKQFGRSLSEYPGGGANFDENPALRKSPAERANFDSPLDAR
ncbi:hypothetical protein Zmor_009423 [Zophobas morio]|uniref:Uncharacterized protein n=1 Tax=Zophobas morio TaxID=2755281 RepID=A0AA38MID5_9CUCU|nr:hypothetical protein Zmor_009423 [Zophobas morio]